MCELRDYRANNYRMKLSANNQRYQVSLSRHWDLSIPVSDSSPQLAFFGCGAASREAISLGDFVGDTEAGGSCNVSRLSLVPHCHGTHTECAGHITDKPLSIQDIQLPAFMLARVITVTPLSAADSPDRLDEPSSPSDLVISAESIRAATTRPIPEALIIRCLPNPRRKRIRNYADSASFAYLSPAAMRVLGDSAIAHLLIDTPSLDRADDGGRLRNHRCWWGLEPPRKRPAHPQRTVTEFVFVPTQVTDGDYALSLQIAPLPGDAAPSRPLLYPLRRRRSR